MTWHNALIAGLALGVAAAGVPWGAAGDAYGTTFRVTDSPPFASPCSPNGLAGWRVSHGRASIAPFAGADEAPLLRVAASSEVVWEWGERPDRVLWVVVGVRPAAGSQTLENLPARPLAAAIGFSEAQGFEALDGDGGGGGIAVALGVSMEAGGEHELALRQNYTRQSYDVYVDGVLRARHLGYRDFVSGPTGMVLGARSGVSEVGGVAIQTATPAGLAYLRGDVRVDGIVTASDLVTLINALEGGPSLELQQAANGDINEDGLISVADRELLAQLLVGEDVP